jgi:hypothetical protein
MWRILFVMIIASYFSPALCAQVTPDKVSCHAAGMPLPANLPHTKKLWDGYEISLGPARNAAGGGDDCTAAIFNKQGQVVYRTTGFSVAFDENETGQDFDGDGKPEVVFRTDTGGGMHCCWEYNVISLWPRPHKLFDVPASGGVRFERDKDGKMVIWVITAGPMEFTSMSQRPFAEKVSRVRGGKMVDATPEFCGRIFSNANEDFQTWDRELTTKNLQKLSEDKAQLSSEERYEREEIVSALLSRAVQHVFCKQFEDAKQDLNLWPEASRSDMKRKFAEWAHYEYPEFAQALPEAKN